MRPNRALLAILVALLHAPSLWAQTLPAVDFPPFDPAACVAKPQRLLIIDMKSGWWSGDGGDFHDLLLPRIVRDCARVEIEYHFLQFIDPASFPGPLPPGVPIGVTGFLSFNRGAHRHLRHRMRYRLPAGREPSVSTRGQKPVRRTVYRGA